MGDDDGRDWGAWSRESVALMQARTDAFVQRFGLSGQPFRWDLDTARIMFACADRGVSADLCVVGSVSAAEGTFLWSWANEAIPPQARARIEEVREFGEAHDLDLLTTAAWPGGRAEGLEMLAVAARILDADGVLVDAVDDLTFFFALHRFQEG